MRLSKVLSEAAASKAGGGGCDSSPDSMRNTFELLPGLPFVGVEGTVRLLSLAIFESSGVRHSISLSAFLW